MPRATATLLVFLTTALTHAQPKAAPIMQAVPQADDQISFQREGVEVARYHYGTGHRRPFLFPIVGPSGKVVTRLGHPHDPVGHSHHNSLWVSHHDVNGINFWADTGKNLGKITHQKILKFIDSDAEAAVVVLNHWINETTKAIVLIEHRRIGIVALPKGELLITLDLRFEAPDEAVFGKTPFGVAAVRVAKSMGVNDGGGTMRNSEGKINEKEIFWQPAKWVDASGPVHGKTIEGITFFDHPSNPNHPATYHVRNDGWMGASLSHKEPRTMAKGTALQLRYGFYIHAGMPSIEELERQWGLFAKSEVPDWPGKKK